MALLKFEPPKELAPLRVKIARPVHERVERYRGFCGALELADVVERALVYVMDRDAETPQARRATCGNCRATTGGAYCPVHGKGAKLEPPTVAVVGQPAANASASRGKQAVGKRV